MKSTQSSVLAGQGGSLAKPPQYWKRRAQQHRKRGEYLRAAALLRHAVALEPTSGDLRVEYARSLRDMSCFEASTREAFGALLLEPSGIAPYRIIGRNMLSLGREQEAIDAFSHYFEKAWDLPEAGYELEEDEELYALEEMQETQIGRGSARLNALCHIGAARLARGKTERANRALARARQLSPQDVRLHTLSAMLCEADQKPEEALTHALAAVTKNPRHVAALCALASIRVQMGRRDLAAAALLKAACFCRFPQEEQLFCFTASALEMQELSLAMLRLAKGRYPGRLPTLFNCAVALLQLGRQEQALVYIHRCLEGDPEDLAVQALFHEAKEWEQQALPTAVVKEKAKALPFYPFLSQQSMVRLLTEMGDAFGEGMEAFVARLLADGECYRGFLYALSLPGAPFSRLIFPTASAAAALDRQAAERMLRDILVQSITEDTAKRYALSALVALEAKPPYVIWQNGRILQAAPAEGGAGSATALQRHIVRRIRKMARQSADPRMAVHALRLLHRMSRPMRCAFAADRNHAWSRGMLLHFRLTYGQGTPAAQWGFVMTDTSAAEESHGVLAKLCKLEPLPQRRNENGID